MVVVIGFTVVDPAATSVTSKTVTRTTGGSTETGGKLVEVNNTTDPLSDSPVRVEPITVVTGGT